MKNHNVTIKLKTKCDDYFFKNALGCVGKIDQATINYNPLPKAKKYLKNIGLTVETNLKIINDSVIEDGIYEDEYFSLMADAYLYKITSVIGFNILLMAESEFSSNNEFLSDQELDLHLNFQHEQIENIVSLLSGIAIPEETTNNIINKISEILPKTIVYAYPLIFSSRVSYYKQMADACSLIDDEGAVYYFERKAIEADKVGRIEDALIFNLPDLKSNNLVKKKIPAFDKNCLKMIEKTFPDLKSTIICRLKNRNAESQILSGTPF